MYSQKHVCKRSIIINTFCPVYVGSSTTTSYSRLLLLVKIMTFPETKPSSKWHCHVKNTFWCIYYMYKFAGVNRELLDQIAHICSLAIVMSFLTLCMLVIFC